MTTQEIIAGRILSQSGNSQPLTGAQMAYVLAPFADLYFSLSTIVETKVSLTAAQLQTINTVPVTLIAAQGAGTAIQVISACARVNYGTVVFDNGADLAIAPATDLLPQMTCAGILQAAGSGLWVFVYPSISDTLDAVLKENDDLVICDPVGTDSTAGDSTIDIYLSYKVITL